MNVNSIPFVSFLVLVVMLTIKIGRMKKRGIKPGSGNREKNTARMMILPVFFLVFLFWLFELARPTFHLKISLFPPMISDPLIDLRMFHFIGVLFTLFSLFFFALTLKAFGSSLRFGLDEKNRGTLITSGIFSVSRNPFFLSLDLFFVGVTMILPSIFHIVFTFAALAGIHFFILKEERFLVKNYGEEYKEYTKKVRRYF